MNVNFYDPTKRKPRKHALVLALIKYERRLRWEVGLIFYARGTWHLDVLELIEGTEIECSSVVAYAYLNPIRRKLKWEKSFLHVKKVKL